MVIVEDIGEREDFLTKNKLLRDGAYIIGMALKAGADEAEAFILKGRDTIFDIENNKISFVSSSSYYGVGIRVISNKKIGFCYATMADKTEDAITRALKLSKLSDKTKFDLPDGSEMKNTVPDLFDTTVIEMEFDGLKVLAESIIENAKNYSADVSVTGGGFGVGVEFVAMVNSRGLEIADGRTTVSASAYCVLKKKGVSTGFDYAISTKLSEVKPDMVGENASRLCTMSNNAKRLQRRVQDVVFMPHALSALVESTLAPAISGERGMTGGSYYYDKLGNQVASEAVILRDDGTIPCGINSLRFDDEGIASQNTIIIENGVLKRFIFDLKTASEFGVNPTGNGVRAGRLSSEHSYKVPPRTIARNLVLESGKGHYIKKTFEDVIAEVDSGIVVYDVMGAHTANPVSGDFSVNVPIAFQIKNGDISKPLKSLMISGNIHKVLNNVVLFSKENIQTSGGLSPVSTFTPALWAEGLNVIP